MEKFKNMLYDHCKMFKPLYGYQIEEVIRKLDLHGEVINLDNKGGGTHWVCLIDKGEYIIYFDSYGTSNIPIEFKKPFIRNLIQFQKNDDPPICGHLCLIFLYLYKITNGDLKIINEEIEKNKIMHVNFIYNYLRK